MEDKSIAEQSPGIQITSFLADLAHANYLPQTHRAYATDLTQLCVFHQGSVQTITAEVLRKSFEMYLHLRPATGVRKQTAVAHLLVWAEQNDLLNNNPMQKIERVRPNLPQPGGIGRSQIERILQAIAAERLRDQLFFLLLVGTGLRVSEEFSLYVEELDLSLNNEHLTIVGKHGKRRTTLLDDPRLVKLFRAFLKQT